MLKWCGTWSAGIGLYIEPIALGGVCDQLSEVKFVISNQGWSLRSAIRGEVCDQLSGVKFVISYQG